MRYLFLLLLAGCAHYGEPLIEDINRSPVTVYTKENEDIVWQCGPNSAGCTIINPGGPCVIGIQPPRGLNDDERFAVIGREFWHCVNGNYHK